LGFGVGVWGLHEGGGDGVLLNLDVSADGKLHYYEGGNDETCGGRKKEREKSEHVGQRTKKARFRGGGGGVPV